MRILGPLQTGVLQRTFTWSGRHYLCASLLWPFRLDTGEAVVQAEMWSALAGHAAQGRVFDQGMPKDRAEFLCLGTFHAPGGTPVTEGALSVRLGERVKELVVSGPREWRTGRASRPEPITELPIRYDQAFGGEGFEDNPVGRGFAAVEDPVTGRSSRPLPCVEYPGEVVTAPTQRPRPASLEGLDVGWRPRRRHAGTYDEAYLRERMPGLPDDLDWRLFNDAPEDQWLDGFLRGDEPFELVNLHPDRPRLAGRLPAVRGRAFVERRVDPDRRDSELAFVEIPLRADTAWFLPEAGLGVMIHRGTMEVADDEAREIVTLMVAHENLSDDARPLDHYRSEMRDRSDPQEGYRYMLDTTPLLPHGCPCALQQMAAAGGDAPGELARDNAGRFAEARKAEADTAAHGALDEARERLQPDTGVAPEQAAEAQASLDAARRLVDGEAPATQAAGELEDIVARLAPGSADGGAVDARRIDFAAMDELAEYSRRIAEEEQGRAEAALRERLEDLRAQDSGDERIARGIAEAEAALARLREPPVLPRPDLDADLAEVEAQLRAVDAHAAELARGGMPPEQIRDRLPDLEQVRETLGTAQERLRAQYRESAHHLPESRSPHPGEEPERGARLRALEPGDGAGAGGDYAFVDLRGATLRGLDLRDAYLEYVDFTGATLIDVDLGGAILAKAILRDCTFRNVRLEDANVGATDIAGACFEGCDFSEARLGRARIAHARFVDCRFGGRQDLFLDTAFERVAFERCALPGVNLIERDLTECAFRGCDLQGANLLQCRLAGADFTEAILDAANFVGSPAPRAVFDRARMENVRFIDEPVLNEASFREARLPGANLRGADLAGAIFSAACVEGADFSEADLTGSVLERLRGVGAQFRAATLERADLRRADLREASLMKAVLRGTRLERANLYSVSLLYTTLGDTGFAGANLDNTILRDWRPLDG
jgi:uncharacterized protein YjbI with pentapeptide repeats